jgi:tetratricopeptide (TPR) repeat protein
MARTPPTPTTSPGKRPARSKPKAADVSRAGAAKKRPAVKAKPEARVEDAPAVTAAGAPQEVPKKLAGFSLPGVGAASTRLRTVVLNFAFVGAFLVLVPVILSQFWRTEVLIDRIPVPAALADIGLTPDVAASRLWDGLKDVTALAGTSKASVTAIPGSQRVQFTLPESGFSMESLIQQTRQFFNAYQTRIGGEFTCGDPSCDPAGIRLRLRVVTDRAQVFDLPPIGDTPLRDYFIQAGNQVLSVLDPFVAIAAIRETQPTRALILARNLIRQNHEDAEWAHNLIGQLRIDDPEAAIAAFRDALAIDKRFFIARSNLASALVQARRYEEAHAEYAVLDREVPNLVNVLQGKVQLALAEKNYDAAEAILSRGAQVHPRDPFFISFMGNVWDGRGDAPKAIASYRRALEMDPAYGPAMFELAKHLLSAGDVAAAEPMFANFLQYEPRNIDAIVLYAAILAGRGALGEAIARLEEGERIAPESTSLLLELAHALRLNNQPTEAIGYYRRAIALDPLSVPAQTELARLQMMTGALDEAIASFRAALELAPNDVDLLDAAAMGFSFAQDHAEAVRLGERAVELEPERFYSVFSLANYYRAAGESEKAVASYRRFLEIAPALPALAEARRIAEDTIAELTASAEATP